MVARAQGCFLGQLIGDALGAQVEFKSPAQIAAAWPDGVRELRDGGTWDILAGQITDDSEMALALARSMVAAGTYDHAAAFAAYVEWSRSNPFDMGNATAQALMFGTPSRETQANGSLMRCAPLGIRAVRSPSEAQAWAEADSRLTHPHEIPTAAVRVFVQTIAHAIETGADAHGVHSTALELASDAPRPVREALRDAAMAAPPDAHGPSAGWVLVALQNAFHQLLTAPTFEQAMVGTIALGGDTDTNAAIAGALFGAVCGVDELPNEWVTTVIECRPSRRWGVKHPRPKEFWPSDALELAAKLLA